MNKKRYIFRFVDMFLLEHSVETLDLLSLFTGDEKYRDLYKNNRKERLQEMSMKSPLDYWWEKGLKEGLEEGLEEGIETRQIKDIEALMETMQEM